MKEINAAYEEIQKQRKGGKSGAAAGGFSAPAPAPPASFTRASGI